MRLNKTLTIDYIHFALVLLTSIFLFSGCSHKSYRYHTNVGAAEGTTYRIIYEFDHDLQSDIATIIDEFEEEFSIYRKESAISKFNRGEKMIATERFKECYSISQTIFEQSNHLFDPTLRPLIKMWGFGEDNKLRNPSETQIDSVMEYVGFDKIFISGDTVGRNNNRISLDFNAIAKGYSVDLVGRFFDSLDIDNYLIEIGGEITTKGKNSSGNPWRIGIDRPIDGNYSPGADLITKVELDGHKGLATSGNYRKFLIDSIAGKVTHTIDPRSGHSVSHNLLSATIIAKNTALADGYATACMVGGTEWSKTFIKKYNLRGILIYVEGDRIITWDSSEQ